MEEIGTGAGHPLLPGELAHRHPRRFQGRVPPRHPHGGAVPRRRPRPERRWRCSTVSFDDPACPETIGQSYYDKLLEDVELLDVAGDPFDLDKVLAGSSRPCSSARATQQLRRGAVLEALPVLHQVAHAAQWPTHGLIEPDGRQVHRLHLQDSGQHEPRPPRPAGVHARVLRRV